jgi:hypothetical protein
MSIVGYFRRFARRLRTRGFFDTAAHSLSVARNKFQTAYIDLRYLGTVATTRQLHANPEWHVSHHTDWQFLNNVFSAVPIEPNDVLVDVGCGDGRVLAYWLSKGLKNKMIGIELDQQTARETARRFSSRPNVQILQGNAADLAAKCGGTLFYLANPFSGQTLKAFADALRHTSARIVFYCYNELSAFDGWRIQKFLQDGEDQQWRFAIITTEGSRREGREPSERP